MNNDISTKIISTYWCNFAAPDYEQRFSWASEKVDEICSKIGSEARKLLIALAESAPGEQAEAYFAAGPLENYINLVIKHGAAEEAAFIIADVKLSKLLQYVWGDVERLHPLAQGVKSSITEDSTPSHLQVLSLKEIGGFWCHVSASQFVDDYDEYYNSTIKRLEDKKQRSRVIDDLLSSAPDDESREYLKDNIFVLHK